MDSIADKLKGWRVAAGIGRHEAAQRLGVSKRIIEAWEQGRREPGKHRDRVLSVISGLHEVKPDLADASQHLAAARALLQRALSADGRLLGIQSKERIEKLWKRLQTDAEELATLAANAPAAGSVL